jgi:2-polyprenyl-3-methyl-5-hydroxy-6-metoxy-1,4-benzoquinol methylase
MAAKHYGGKMKETRLDRPVDRFLTEQRTARALEHVKPGSAVLDIGAGDCLVRERVATRRYIPLDLDFGHDVERMKSFGNGFDYVLMLAVLEHLKNPGAVLKKTYASLKPGGKLIITTLTPAAALPFEIIARLRLIKDSADCHERYFGKQELTALLAQAGFTVSDYKTFEFGMNQVVAGEKPAAARLSGKAAKR